MKKFKHLFTVLLLLFSVAVNAHNFAVKGIYYNITNSINKTVEVTYKGSSYSEYSNEYTGSVVIPESVTYNGNTYSVTSIGNSAFSNCSGLTSIEIPNSVTSIGNDAFLGCFGLTSVEIPNSVTSIGMGAFYVCSRLTSVVIGNSVTSIGDYAFNGCTSLKDLRIEDGEGTLSLGYHTYNSSGTGKGMFYDCPLETLYLGRDLSYNASFDSGNSPFYNKKTLASVTIGNSVTSIGSSAFSWCSKLTSVVIPNSVTSIGEGAFFYCSGLTSVTIGNSVTSIGNSAFGNCSGLTSVVIPNSVTSIGEGAFFYCSGLTNIEIPGSVTSIEDNAFSYCSGLTSIEIPNSVTSIGSYAFYKCSGLTSVVIGNSVTSIGGSAFEGTAWYNKQPNGVVYAGNVLYKYKGDMPSNTSIKINEGTSGIAGSAFSGCSGLTSIEIPNSVTSIGEEAFYGCKNLKTVINNSNLNFEKGSKSYGYIAYYADIVITPVNGVSPITSLAELSNSSVYYIYQPYHSKGATSWAVAKDGNALKSNKDLNIAIDENDTCQQFAILSIDGGVTRYLYHIETQMFVNLDGSLSATPVNAISFMNGAYTNIFIAYFDNEHYVNVGDKQEMIIDDWDTPDGGNSCLIIPVGEFDPSNALEMFEGYTTEIDEIQDENEKVVYDLNGRRIVDAEYLERGVYIINGKKVVY